MSQSKGSRATMASNAELAQDTYADWSNEDLMSRVNQLEAQLKAQQSEIEKYVHGHSLLERL